VAWYDRVTDADVLFGVMMLNEPLLNPVAWNGMAEYPDVLGDIITVVGLPDTLFNLPDKLTAIERVPLRTVVTP
jgi:hypothetical protein